MADSRMISGIMMEALYTPLKKNEAWFLDFNFFSRILIRFIRDSRES